MKPESQLPSFLPLLKSGAVNIDDLKDCLAETKRLQSNLVDERFELACLFVQREFIRPSREKHA